MMNFWVTKAEIGKEEISFHHKEALIFDQFHGFGDESQRCDGKVLYITETAAKRTRRTME